MKQRGVLFTTDNRVAIREDHKTMTRRIPVSFKEINEHPDEWGFMGYLCKHKHNMTDTTSGVFRNKSDGLRKSARIPWSIGDELYIKESHYLYGFWGIEERNGKDRVVFHPNRGVCPKYPDSNPASFELSPNKATVGFFLRSPLFMPKWAARDWLRVTDVKVERLHSINEEDAVAEGQGSIGQAIIKSEEFGASMPGAIYQYAKLWNSINRKRHPWERNEWVVAYTFERILGSAEPVQSRC